VDERVRAIFEVLDEHLRKASVAKIGGFRPPEDPVSSWFGGRGVGLPGERLPRYGDREMFPLLQVRVDELPYVPEGLAGVRLFVVFQDREEIAFDKPHGEGWLIREYGSLEGLAPLPEPAEEAIVRPFPMRWELVEDEAPDWEDAQELVDINPLVEDSAAFDQLLEQFHDRYGNHPGTKVGGYPSTIQHGAGTEGFVFQIGSEEKPRWVWVDDGVAHYHKSTEGEWRFSCQFY
jgi:hypothetical protein